MVVLPLKKSDDPTAPRVVLTRRSGADPSKVLPETVVKLGSMIIDILYSEDDNYVIAGSILISDYKDASMSYAHLFNPIEARTVYTCFRDAYALRPKGVYLINTPGFIETIYNSVKSWIPKFLQDMVHIYSNGDPEEMYETVPRDIMPKEYGGGGGTLEELTADWKAKVESHRDWFIEDEKYCLYEGELPEETTESSWFGMGWLMNKLSFE